MARSRILPVVAYVWLYAFLVSPVRAYPQEYCSSFNTADGSPQDAQFMTTGLCHDKCLSSAAFAVVQGNSCWCSDFAPATSVDVGQCNQVCPGYGSEQCGNTKAGLYGYVALNKPPSGTSGTPSSSSMSSTSSSTSASSSSVFSSSISSSSTSTSDSSSHTTTSDSSTIVTTSSSETTSWTPTPVTTLVTITNGQIRTVTTTPTDQPSALPIEQSSPASGLSNPANAAGLGVGLALLFLLFVGIIVFLWARRRARKFETLETDAGTAVGRYGSGSSRPVSSTMSQILGLSKRHSGLPKLQTDVSGESTASQYHFGDGSNNSPTGISSSNKRRSNPLIVDQRLDPGTLWLNDNGSKASLGSLRDDRDYSRRVLKLANPDEPENAEHHP